MPRLATYSRKEIEEYLNLPENERQKKKYRKFHGCKIESDRIIKVDEKNGDKIIVAKEDSEDIIKKYYHDPKTGFLSANKLYSSLFNIYAGINRKSVRDYIAKVNSYQQTRPKKQERTIKPIISKRPFSIWQVDLIDIRVN